MKRSDHVKRNDHTRHPGSVRHHTYTISERARLLCRIIPAGALFILAFAAVFILLRNSDTQEEATVEQYIAGAYTREDLIEIGPYMCTPRQNLLTYLFIGVDYEGTLKELRGKGSNGQADVLRLLVIDKAADTFAWLDINRGIVTAVDSIDEKGNVLGTYEEPICLAHSYGEGSRRSCQNTTNAVSELLLGQQIDGYYAVNMGAIKMVNKELGGITVTLKDDFTSTDPAMKAGASLTLTDEQAYHYIHDRMNVADGTNTNRMQRQQEYINAAVPIVKERLSANESYIFDLRNLVEDYSYTNMTDKDLSYIAKAVIKNRDLGTFRIEGEEGEDPEHGYLICNMDPESRDSIVAELFYTIVDSSELTQS